MSKYTYSVVIRTLGAGGAKYESLLKSLAAQTISPIHIYVFIAEGYALPKERIGNEEFIYCRKGMWRQRIYGMEYAAGVGDSDYLFVIDDDIKFSETFINECMDIIHQYEADILIPGVSRDNNPPYSRKGGGIYRLKTAILGLRYETAHSEWRVKIARTAGYVVNTDNSVNVLKTQSGPFNGFLIKSAIVQGMKLSEENWLDDTAYSLPDDQVFFYKAFCAGWNVINCISPFIVHLDHGGTNPDRLLENALPFGRNFYIFWYKFLFLKAAGRGERMKLRVAIEYRLLANRIWMFIKGLIHWNFDEYASYINGIKMARSFVKKMD